MKKVLILSVTAGNGHNAIGKAIEDGLIKTGNTVKFLDIFKDCNAVKKYNTIDKGYLFICQNLVSLYNFVYKKLLKRKKQLVSKTVLFKNVNSIIPSLYQQILEFKPQVIICTHVFGAIAINNITKILPIPCVTYGILTDYVLHPFWEYSTNINYLLIPDNMLKQQAIEAGYNDKQIITTGLPTHNKFLKDINLVDARKKLGLEPDLFTILIILGKACYKNVKKMIKSILNIDLPFQLIVINGKSKKYFYTINKLIYNTDKKVINLSFVNNIEIYYSASNMVISKVGATTLNETLNKNLPLFTYCKLPQQEIDNLNYLIKHKATENIKSIKHLCEIISQAIINPDYLNKFKENIQKIKKIDACDKIVNLVINTEMLDERRYIELSDKIFSNKFKQ